MSGPLVEALKQFDVKCGEAPCLDTPASHPSQLLSFGVARPVGQVVLELEVGGHQPCQQRLSDVPEVSGQVCVMKGYAS